MRESRDPYLYSQISFQPLMSIFSFMTCRLHIYQVFGRMSVMVGGGQVKSQFQFLVYKNFIHVFYEF